MSLNVMAYCIYLVITTLIILWVGRILHKNGRVFMLNLMQGNTHFTDTLNNILLVAYYLFNMGYALLIVTTWNRVETTAELIASLSSNLGLLILILAVTHYFNLWLVHYLSHKNAIIHS
ncbi:MAG TPA: hypothetical protein VL098_06695 [Flavipsychrobacter sp.]|nr:hypothetical protein [Flavipsychrobacter sp.]